MPAKILGVSSLVSGLMQKNNTPAKEQLVIGGTATGAGLLAKSLWMGNTPLLAGLATLGNGLVNYWHEVKGNNRANQTAAQVSAPTTSSASTSSSSHSSSQAGSSRTQSSHQTTQERTFTPAELRDMKQLVDKAVAIDVFSVCSPYIFTPQEARWMLNEVKQRRVPQSKKYDARTDIVNFTLINEELVHAIAHIPFTEREQYPSLFRQARRALMDLNINQVRSVIGHRYLHG